MGKGFRFIPTGYVEVYKDDDGIVYAQKCPRRPGGINARAFSGKRNKPDFYCAFRSDQELAAAIKRWVDSRRLSRDYKAKQQTERRAAPRGLEVGDMLYTSWGYDQTNVEWYEVTRLVGDRMVEVRQVRQKSVDTGYMTGRCVPLAGDYCGEPIRCVARNGTITVDGHSAWKAQPVADVAGAKVYAAKNWTSYA